MFRRARSVEPVDHKLGSGYALKLGDALKAAFSQSDLVILGDTEHTNSVVVKALEDPDMIRSAAEAGVTHIMSERGQDESMNLQLYDLCEQLHMQLHNIDPMLGAEKRPIFKGGEAQVLKMTSDRIGMDSTHLAPNIRNAVPEGEKGLVIYGAAHFTTEEDPLVLASMDILKIDVYEDHAHYKESMALNKSFNRRSEVLNHDDRRVYTNVPEAVYFIDKGTIHTTADTPDWFKAKLEALAAPAPGPKAQYTPESAPVTPTPMPGG